MRFHRSSFPLRTAAAPGIVTVAAAAALMLLPSGCTNTGTSGGGAGGTGGGSAAPAASSNVPAQDTSVSEINVGHYASLTGDTATFGTDTDNGIKLAEDDLNAKGGVLGKKFAVETEDDQSKPEEAQTVATKFANDPKMVAALGEVASSRSIAAAPIFQRAGMPMISPSSTNPKVTQIGDNIFRVCFIDTFQGYVMAKFSHDNLHAAKVAILRDQKQDYSVGLADSFTDAFKKLGGTISVDTSYQSGDNDFRSQLAQIKATNPDAIFVPGYYDTVGTIARQAREQGITVPLMGCDGWDSDKLVEGAGGPGKALEGCYFSNHYSKDDKSPRVQAFVKAYQAKYKKAPSSLAALGYDAMMLLGDAIKRANSIERAKVRDAIASTKGFPGVTGVITINANRDADKPAVVLQIKGNEFAYVTTVQPPKDASAAPAAAAASPAAAPSTK